MLDSCHKLLPNLETIPKLKDARQPIWSALPEKTIKNATNDFHKRLQAHVSTNGRHFEHKT